MREELPDAMMVYPWGQTEPEFEPTAIASLRHPAVIVSSDGVYHGPLAHPRGFGAFPRVLRRFVRELGVVSLPEAIWKMSGLPAQRYGLRDRGRIEIGMAADLVVFDPATVADRATYTAPRQSPVGIETVIVNGQIAIDRGAADGDSSRASAATVVVVGRSRRLARGRRPRDPCRASW